MIPVIRQAEPANFDQRVRQRGLQWLANRGFPLQGALPRNAKLPDYWTECLKDLRDLYQGICAYIAVYIPEVVGNPSVEHFRPKSLYAEHVYEWNNYRFVCGLLNSCKGNHEDVLDPFEIAPRTFELTHSLNVVPGAATDNDDGLKNSVNATIRRLKLNDTDRKRLRTRLWEAYLKRSITAEVLREESPFVAAEMVRLGQMDPGATGLMP